LGVGKIDETSQVVFLADTCYQEGLRKSEITNLEVVPIGGDLY